MEKEVLSTIDILPDEFKIQNITPNPFADKTTISYTVEKDSKVKIIIYNTFGGLEVTLVYGNKQKGVYEVDWIADEIEPGTYTCILEAESFTEDEIYRDTKKIQFLGNT